MSRLRLYGAPYSAYVRICRIALAEKGLAYELDPVDVFAECGVPTDYLALNPFGRIPALEHDGFVIFETDAIAAYIDEVFEGSALMPEGAQHRARARQIMRIADTVLFPKGVWGLYVAWEDDGSAGDPAPVRQALQVIDGLAGEK